MAQPRTSEQPPGRIPPPHSMGTAEFAAAADAAITVELLLVAEPANNRDYYESIVDAMSACASAYQINTPLRIAHFLAQIGHESKFRSVAENGYYEGPRMRQIFGCGRPGYDKATNECKLGAKRLRPKLWTEEAKYARHPENLLNYVYALRLGNGDEASGDGFRYRGRGFMQLTGKDNYKQFTASHNRTHPADVQDFVAHPDLLVSELKYGTESAFFFWDTRNINADADRDDLKAVTIDVNGGTNGLPDRRARLERIKKAMGI